jgi:hypothetical protein
MGESCSRPGSAISASSSRTLALGLVRLFDRFTPDNDPHDEHDFGSIELHGRKLFWKID